MNNDHSQRAHATFSPSSLKSLEICPLYQKDEDSTPHPITLRGTAMHEAVETGKFDGLDPYEIEMVKTCLDFQSEWSMDQTWAAYPERRMGTPGGQWGFCDNLFVRGREAVLLDWKFSTRVQTQVGDNIAAQAYVWGVLNDFPDIMEVAVHYVYPRLDVISSHVYTRDDLPRIELRVETIIARAKLNTPESAMPTEENCLYCARKATCPALHQIALPLAREYKKEELTIVEEYHPSQITDPSVMAKAMAVASIMGEWAESVKFHANKMRRESGQEIPGYSWTSRKGDAVVNSAALVKFTADEFGLNDDDIVSAMSLSVSKLAEKIGEKAKTGQKKAQIEAFKNTLIDSGAIELKPDTFFLRRDRKTKY
jgi:hypothetical protein